MYRYTDLYLIGHLIIFTAPNARFKIWFSNNYESNRREDEPIKGGGASGLVLSQHFQNSIFTLLLLATAL